jgi:uncharacterized membrane protein
MGYEPDTCEVKEPTVLLEVLAIAWGTVLAEVEHTVTFFSEHTVTFLSEHT